MKPTSETPVDLTYHLEKLRTGFSEKIEPKDMLKYQSMLYTVEESMWKLFSLLSDRLDFELLRFDVQTVHFAFEHFKEHFRGEEVDEHDLYINLDYFERHYERFRNLLSEKALTR